jgi:hypothetical protein
MELKELQDRVTELTALVTQKEEIIGQLQTTITQYQEAERQAQAEKRKNVLMQQLSTVFSESELAEKIEFYLAMDDSVFQKVFLDMTKNTKTVSEKKDPIPVPEPTANTEFDARDPKKLAGELKKILRGEI